MQKTEFSPTNFCLDMFCPFLLYSKLINEIDIQYKRVPIKAKIKFYLDEMKVEIWHFEIFILENNA